MMKKITALGLIAVMSLAGAACADATTPAPANTSSTSEPSVKTSTGIPAPDFTVPVARISDGVPGTSTFSLAAHRGKPAVLYFSFVG